MNDDRVGLLSDATLRIVYYPHPTLRYMAKPVRRIDDGLRRLVKRMFELMYEAKGVGLAANQVDVPLRLFVVNLAAKPDEGEERVFINPVISSPQGWEEDEEGCLSLPGIYAPVKRPKRVRVQAFDLGGNEIIEDVSGLLARVVQHELDHLDGVLFIDRVDDEEHREEIARNLAELERRFSEERQAGAVPDDIQIAQRRELWLKQYA
ncbi:MAG: peptide deformylase [Pirellulaceae bacterium]|nr:MAG: peptide deformylase [Pirellulaceae bacterium]